MEERSTKHSPRIDDSLTEPAADGEPAVSAVTAFAAEPIPGALGEEEQRRRSELAIALRPSAFPGARDALIRTAIEENAPDWVLELLGQLPIDTRFDTVQDVWETLGGHHEVRHVAEAPPEEVAAPERATPAPRPQPATGRSPVAVSLGLAWAGIEVGMAAVHATAAVVRRVVHTSERLLHLGS